MKMVERARGVAQCGALGGVTLVLLGAGVACGGSADIRCPGSGCDSVDGGADHDAGAVVDGAPGPDGTSAPDAAEDSAVGPRCGDGMCDVGEACSNCASDCGSCPARIGPEPAPDFDAEPILGNDYYVAVDGDDGADGSMDAPWGTIAYAFAQLTPGDTLLVRGGTHRTCSPRLGQTATADAPVRIRNYPGEEVRFICPRNSAYDDPAAAWELSDASIQLYRSTEPWSGNLRHAARIEYMKEGALHFFSLTRYPNMDDLRSTWHDMESETHPFGYRGPGYAPGADGRVYIRLEHNPPTSVYAQDAPAWADMAPLTSTDPRDYRIALTDTLYGMWFEESASHIYVQGITTQGQYNAGRILGADDIVLRNMTFEGWGWVVAGGSTNIVFEHCRFDGGLTPWTTWLDVKGGRVGSTMKLGAITVDERNGQLVDGLTVRDSTMVRLFDGVVSTGGSHGIRVLRNHINVKDDAVQLGSSAYDFEFAYNYVLGPSVSHHGSGDSPFPGTKYLHHNIIDADSKVTLWSRNNPDGASIKDTYAGGWKKHMPFPSHEGSTSTGDQWNIYNNTVQYGFGTSTAVLGSPNWKEPLPDGAGGLVLGTAFNNILVMTDDRWITRGWRPDRVIADGNIYFRSFPAPTEPRAFFQLFDGTDSVSYPSLAELRADSTLLTFSQMFYPPGYEASGTEADPMLDANFVPQAGSPAEGGAVDLTGLGWPGVDVPYRPYRGAVEAP